MGPGSFVLACADSSVSLNTFTKRPETASTLHNIRGPVPKGLAICSAVSMTTECVTYLADGYGFVNS